MSYEEGSRQNSSFNLSQHRVLQLLPTMDSGGVEGTTVEICEALLEAGSVPFVATQKGRLLKKLIQAGVMWIPGSYATKNPFKILSNIFYWHEPLRDTKSLWCTQEAVPQRGVGIGRHG